MERLAGTGVANQDDRPGLVPAFLASTSVSERRDEKLRSWTTSERNVPAVRLSVFHVARVPGEASRPR